MGGLALKHFGVKRASLNTYTALSELVAEGFDQLFGYHPVIIPSYFSKKDFGDCDMLIFPENLPEDWRERFLQLVESKGMVRNGDVTSIEVRSLQFDFIGIEYRHLEVALAYFAYNDLGNLIGRVAHKLGFSYGSTGLVLKLRDSNHMYGKIEVSIKPSEILTFLGYDYNRFMQGFAHLEDIFEFAASSKYFSPEIYLLDNRNAVSRRRDAKRKTYSEFLKWCETYVKAQDREPIDKAQHLLRAYRLWPDLESKVAKVEEERSAKKALAEKWNGHKVMEWTGLSGKSLGEFMSFVKPTLTDALLNDQLALRAHVEEIHAGWRVN